MLWRIFGLVEFIVLEGGEGEGWGGEGIYNVYRSKC